MNSSALRRFTTEPPPYGWLAYRVADGVGLRNDSLGARIEAVETATEATPPSVGRDRRWELRRRHVAGEASSVRRLGVAETGADAVAALYDHAERIAASEGIVRG